MHPFKMDGVDRILLALKPIARHTGDDDLNKAILPREGLPVGQLWRRGLAKISPNQSPLHLGGVGLDLDP